MFLTLDRPKNKKTQGFQHAVRNERVQSAAGPYQRRYLVWEDHRYKEQVARQRSDASGDLLVLQVWSGPVRNDTEAKRGHCNHCQHLRCWYRLVPLPLENNSSQFVPTASTTWKLSGFDPGRPRALSAGFTLVGGRVPSINPHKSSSSLSEEREEPASSPAQ